MLLGLEQYLGIDPELFQPLQSSISLSQILPESSSDVLPAEMIEDCNSNESPDQRELHGASMAERSSSVSALTETLENTTSLMSVLSGKQAHKKRRKKRCDSRLPKPKEESALTPELSEADLSFNSSEFEKNLQHQKFLIDLEGKVYGNNKSVSAGELLRKSTSQIVEVHDEDHALEIEMNKTKSGSSNARRIAHTEPEGKRVNAKHLFDGFPKRTRNSNGKWSMKIRLRISPAKLALVKQSENPCVTRGIPGSGASLMSALMSRKPSKKVTFKLPKTILEEFEKALNPLYTKSSGNANGKPAKSVFDMMMQSASKSTPKLTAIQKLKELDPPQLSRTLLHVVPYEVKTQVNDLYMTLLPLRCRAEPEYSSSDEGFFVSLTEKQKYSVHLSLDTSTIRSKVVEIGDVLEHIKSKAPFTQTKNAHKRIVTDFILRQEETSKFLLWPQKFQPPNLETLLLPAQKRTFIKEWILNAFNLLKGLSTKKPRVTQLREQQRRQKQRDTSMMSGFIVDDLEETEESEEDIFVPLLIVRGPTGSCKSSSIYAAMNSLGGYVYEVNAGQQRSRKDIYGSLKEFCTTQIVRHSGEDKEFQKGVVLFEDCDILFEQDKTFWTLVQDVLNFSKRPIVLTVTDDIAIPKSIRDLAEEQDAIVSVKNCNMESFKQYLWICSFSQGYDLSTSLQEKIVQECNVEDSFDLRKALMMCQWICGKKQKFRTYSEIHYFEKRMPENDYQMSINSLSERLEDISISDIISNNTVSSVLQERQANELLDVYVIHDSLHSTQPTLPFELNIGKYIQKSLRGDYDSQSTHGMLFNTIRRDVIDFISSRSKPIPKFLRDMQTLRSQTRSRSLGSPFEEQIIETQHLPETSAFYSTPNTSFVLDFGPYARLWAQFQKGIIKWDEDHAQDKNVVQLEQFLNWRRFHGSTEKVIRTL